MTDNELAVREGWTDTSAHPWRRFFARAFDNLVIGGLLWFGLSAIGFMLSPTVSERVFGLFDNPFGRLLDGVLTAAMMVPVLAVVIGLSGGSPGKWIFGVRVADRQGRPLGPIAALVREAKVWAFGLGAGIPIVTLFTLASSKAALEQDGHARWDDRARVQVTHRPDHAVQRVLTFLGIVFVLFAVAGMKVLAYLPELGA
jgi:uncharacterized RDD family membrane protein YckC